MKSPYKIWIKVELEKHRHETVDGFTYYNPRPEGAEVESYPFQGVLYAAPANFPIPNGTYVYTSYLAVEDRTKIDGEDFYITYPENIIAYGEYKTPFNCLIVEPLKEKIETDFIIPEDPKYITTKAKVLKSGVDGYEAGDIIEYGKNLDWECLLGTEIMYYIQWVHKIYKVNGELVNDFLEVLPREKEIKLNGLIIPNPNDYYECVGGRLKGYKIGLWAKQHLQQNRFISYDFVSGIFEDSPTS